MMDSLRHTSEERRKVEAPQEISTSGFDSKGYTKEIIPLENRYNKDKYIQQLAKHAEQISEELTKLEQTIPDLPKLELDEKIHNRIEEYEKKQEEQKLFPALRVKGQPPIFWKIKACENRIKHGEKRINSLAKYNESCKDLEGGSEDLLNLYRYLQKRHYQRFGENCKDLKKVCLYLFKEHDKELKYNYEDIAEKYEISEQKRIEKQYIVLKEQYRRAQSLKKIYDDLESSSKDYKKSHDKKEGPHNELKQSEYDKKITSRRENLRDLEEGYQHQYQNHYENLEKHLIGLKRSLRKLEASRYTYLEKNLQGLQEASSYLIEHCEGLGEENSKYLEKISKKLKEEWEVLEKPDQNLEERCKVLEERWKDFVESSKTAYLSDIKVLHEKMVTQKKELSEILDICNDKKKNLMKLKYSIKNARKELPTSGERSQKPETSSYEDDSHSVSTGFEDLHIELARHIDQLEKLLDDKRAIIHQDLKHLSFHLEGKLQYFLDKQKHKTDFYLKNSHLLHLPKVHLECGIACTVMVADLLKSWKNVENLLQNFAEVYPKVLREDTKGLTATYTYPIILKRIGHHINYEYAKVPDIAKKKYQDPKTDAKWDKAYHSHMGKDPKEITVDDFKNAIGQKDKDGNVIPVIASITMDFHTKCYHAIVLDGWDKTPEGEELLVVRDIHTEISPETDKPLTNNQGRLWKDFLEVWTGVAVIPAIESDPN